MGHVLVEDKTAFQLKNVHSTDMPQPGTREAGAPFPAETERAFPTPAIVRINVPP